MTERSVHVDDETFTKATLQAIQRCAARSNYIELCFETDNGPWRWCVPQPPEQPAHEVGRLAVTLGRYGVQAHLVEGDSLGWAITSAEAVPAILMGADVLVERRLVGS